MRRTLRQIPAQPPVEAVDGAGGVTSSLTTHEDPDRGGAGTDRVSDIFVTVAPAVNDPDDTDDEKDVQVVDADGVDDTVDGATVPNSALRDSATIMNPVLVDANGDITTGRMANFDAEADWDNNPPPSG